MAAIQQMFVAAMLIGPIPRIRDIATKGATASTSATRAMSQAHARDFM